MSGRYFCKMVLENVRQRAETMKNRLNLNENKTYLHKKLLTILLQPTTVNMKN